MTLVEYFDQIYIVHLPHRTDRYDALKKELQAISISISGPKVQIPDAPIMSDPQGFPSAGVLGSFLSHLGILKDAQQSGHEKILVLEDDAIFRACLRKSAEQAKLVSALASQRWGMCFLGHPLKRELYGKPLGLTPYRGHFKWAHCYAVHRSGLNELVGYLEETMKRPAGHPSGGKLYIDAAFSLFRDFFPTVEVLVANPSLSSQKGSPSSLAGAHWYDNASSIRPIAHLARAARDEAWRRRMHSFRSTSPDH